MIEISKGVYVVDEQKFTEIYESRKEAVAVLSSGVLERMELFKIAKNKT